MPDAPSLAEFETEVRPSSTPTPSPEAPVEEFVWGEGDDDVAMFEEVDRDAEARQLAEAKAWRGQALRRRPGLDHRPDRARRPGPRPRAYDRLYGQLESGYETPNQSFFGIGLGMVAPTIQAHGTPRPPRPT